MIYLGHLTLGRPADSHLHMIHNLIIFSTSSANDVFMYSSLYFSQNNSC